MPALHQSAASPAQSAWRFFLPLAWLLAGCGADEYDHRLDNTRILYQHIEKLTENLKGEWSDDEVGVRLRVPKQFEMIPAPPRPAKSAGAAAQAPVADPRQPRYLNLELPGLRGAFAARLAIVGANNARAQADGHLYVLSNHGSADKAATFHDDVVRLVCDAARVTPPAKNEWKREQFPGRRDSFVAQVSYDVVSPVSAALVGGVQTQLQIDLFRQGEVQVALVWMIPKDVDTSEKLGERIPMCLETLKVLGDRVTRPGAGSGATGAPKATGGF
ncbi:MAG: hypothetical protein ACT4QC_08745 [Planctomycetaceae bacterium]